MIKNRALDNLVGLMEDVTKANGKMENKMEKAHTEIRKECKKMEHG